ncbi:uncharacterized protein LOC135818531 [Sycon ciliatum]|uniref:uncharacterized protein LOC135818531 n=1 Tax=Sycon ciliatum TaxID=27933 RepID=UPI0020ADFCFE
MQPSSVLFSGPTLTIFSTLLMLTTWTRPAAGQHIAGPHFNVSLRFKTDSGRLTTMQLVRNGEKRGNLNIDKKLNKRFNQLGFISSSTDSIVIRWQAQHDMEVKYSFAVYADIRRISSSTVGGNTSGYIPRKRSCIGLQLACVQGLNEAEKSTESVFVLLTFSNSRNEALPGDHILLKLKRSCGPGQCPPPLAIANGRVLAGETEKCRPGMMTYRCNHGYRRVGCESSTCMNGRWSCPEPTCVFDWTALWKQRASGKPPCGQDVQCQPLIDPHSDACHQMSTPGDLGNLENVLCAADYVLIVRLPFLYTQAQAEKIKRERGFRIVSEPIFPMRNKSQHTTTRSRIYFNSNTEYCPKVIEQLRYDSSMPSNRKFLVVGQRNRHYPSRIVIGTVDNTSRYHHGLLLIYDEFERYFEEILRRSVINSSLLGANTITDFKSYAGSLRC